MMRKFLIAPLATFLGSNFAFAVDATCEARAAKKELAVAAKNSFTKKCVTDAVK